ncbi:2Fe-2S iron-sulfur cluster binding domain-containing protein [Thiopseudomonas sp. 4R-3cl]|nr:2Fe-2S iron-sulfur cluster binding domain-containing protein [Thiopseudomonas sp. 4R-3cl]
MAQYHTITIDDTQESFRCLAERSVLQGMEALGKRGIPVGCRQGGCGVCKVRVLEGSYAKRVMSRAHVSAEEEAEGCVLSCRIKPTSDLRVAVLGAMKKNVCRPLGTGEANRSIPTP